MSREKNYRYQHVNTFQELEQEIMNKHFEVTLAEKQLEMSTLEIRYQLSPGRLLNSLWKKGLEYLINLF